MDNSAFRRRLLCIESTLRFVRFQEIEMQLICGNSRARLAARTLAALCVFVTPLIVEAAERATGWQPGFTLAPYGWLAGLDGTMGAGGADDGGISLPPRLDVSTDDEWSEIGFMFYGEWRGERWTAFFDSVWANVSQDGDITLGSRLPDSKAEVTFDGNIYQIGLGYRLLDWDRTFVTVYGGGRYYDVESKIEARDGLLPNKITASATKSWSDGVIGARWSHDFGRHWSTSILADVGFGDSRSAWQVFGTLDYQFSWGKVLGGYRYMNLDYENGDYKINLALSGPVLGAAFTF